MIEFHALLAAALFACSATVSDETASQPVELGQVQWNRDHDKAFTQAQAKNLPVFLLFQEIPG